MNSSKKFAALQQTWLWLAALLLLTACTPPPAEFRNTDLTGATFGRHLQLQSEDGKRRSLVDFRGKAVVVFFGYTTCPDICPTTLARYAEVWKELGGQAASVQLLFVTLDPERDNPARLGEYLRWFNPAFVGLIGSPEELKEATGEFRVFSARKEIGGGTGYVIDHSTGAYVFDPAGRLRLYVKDSAPVADIVADLRLLLAGR
ncbi:MAG: SCO family protein [Betaproteobacteria bacterium]|nr:SCO family protein [Betaproteobacteria bacterium]